MNRCLNQETLDRCASVQMKLFSDNIGPTEKRRLTRDILVLAMPVFIAGGINSFVGFITRIFMSELGVKAFNSINICMMVFFLIILVVIAISVGTTTLVAQNWGSNNKDRVGEILQQSLIVGFLLSFLIALLGLATRRILFQVLRLDAATTEIGVEFLFWLYLGLPFFSPGFFLSAALRGAGDTRTPMYAGLLMAVISLVLSYGLILGKLGMPRLEAVGAALAIDISFMAFTLIQAFLIFTKRTILNLPLKSWRVDYRTGSSILRIGLPSAAEWSLIQIGFLLYISVVTFYGPDAMAGFFTGVAIVSLSQSLTQGFQAASTTLVGQMVGAQDYSRAETVFRQSAFLGCAVMSICSVIFALGANATVLSFLFKELNPRSIEYASNYTLLLCLVMPLMGISFSIAGGLRGAGKTVEPLIAAIIGVYGGRIAFAFLIYYLFKPPVYIVWCSMFPDLIIRIIVMVMQLKSGKWKTVKVRL
jgi:putative MATE family efflux protein